MIRNGDHQQGVCPVKYLQEVWASSPGIQRCISTNTTPSGTPATPFTPDPIQMFFGEFSCRSRTEATTDCANPQPSGDRCASKTGDQLKKKDKNYFNKHIQNDLYVSRYVTKTCISKQCRNNITDKTPRCLPALPLINSLLTNGRATSKILLTDRILFRSIYEGSERCFWSTDTHEWPRIRSSHPQLVFSHLLYIARKIYFFMDPHWTSRTPW